MYGNWLKQVIWENYRIQEEWFLLGILTDWVTCGQIKVD